MKKKTGKTPAAAGAGGASTSASIPLVSRTRAAELREAAAASAATPRSSGSKTTTSGGSSSSSKNLLAAKSSSSSSSSKRNREDKEEHEEERMMLSVRYTRNLFLRGLCVVYLFAFLSFYVQIPGLYGDNGVLPAKTQLDLRSRAPMLEKLKQKPTVLWFAPYLSLNVEYMLDFISLIGVLLSFFGFVSQKFCMAPVFAILWVLYYSVYQIGQTFMWFQWDILLLETGFLGILVAPFFSFKGKKSTPSDSVSFWAVRWLLFRFMFSSGVVKLTSGCPVWWNLDALSIHFESQCIPTPLAWYAHQLPKWYLRLSTVGALVFELAVPFLFFFPVRKVRLVAFYLQMFLQVHIMATGNYNFFNLLTMVLCLSLLDDNYFYKKKSKANGSRLWGVLTTLACVAIYAAIAYASYVYFNLKLNPDWTISSRIGFNQPQFEKLLRRVIPISVYAALTSLGLTVAGAISNSVVTVKGTTKKITTTIVTLLYAAAVIFVFAISVIPYAVSLNPSLNATLPRQLKAIHAKTEHLHLVNSYGLFRRMTGVGGRPEVIIEGSDEIEGPWREYHFLYKPGHVNNSLPFVAPHQPRLDWQMWFAALGTYHQNPWLMSLAYRLLNGQPEVLALMNNNASPFRDNPPKFVRASLYNYHYAPPSKNPNAQSWWTRERTAEYFPIFSRDHPPLIEYLIKMKVIQDSSYTPTTNEYFKDTLNFVRALVRKVESTLLMWSVFTAGCAIVMTR